MYQNVFSYFTFLLHQLQLSCICLELIILIMLLVTSTSCQLMSVIKRRVWRNLVIVLVVLIFILRIEENILSAAALECGRLSNDNIIYVGLGRFVFRYLTSILSPSSKTLFALWSGWQSAQWSDYSSVFTIRYQYSEYIHFLQGKES